MLQRLRLAPIQRSVATAEPDTSRDAAARSTGLARAAQFLEANAPRILLALIVLYVVVFFITSFYKYENYGQGYDQVDFEQAIWNTIQGRPFEDSRFNFTESIFGLDWMPLLAVFVPFYALIQSPHTLFFLQILAGGIGAVPVYLLARDKLGSKTAGLVFGALWLLYPTMEHGITNPFQIRIFAVTALLFALLYFEREKLWPFLGCCAVAILARTDVSLVVIMFAAYALLYRRKWPFVVAPLLLGGGYFLVVMTFVVPAFVHLPPVNCVRTTDLDVLKGLWPGSNNPNLGYYLHWGCTPGEIVKNLVSDPLFTLNYMFGSLDKIGYLLGMLAPFGLLALLDLRGLVLALPILGMNLIAWRDAQIDIEKQYSLLITVGVVAASIYGCRNLLRFIERLRGERVENPNPQPLPRGARGAGLVSGQGSAVGVSSSPLGGRENPNPQPLPRGGRGAGLVSGQASAVSASGSPSHGRKGLGVRAIHLSLFAGLLVFALLVNLWLHNPVIRTFRADNPSHEPPAKVAAANTLVAMVPQEAHVAASSFLAPHLLPRRYIYNFPPAPYSPYSMDNFGSLEYILIDPGSKALDFNRLPNGKTALEELRDSPEWTLLKQEQDLLLYKRR